MQKARDSAAFFLCSLIEYIGRQQKRARKDVVNLLGKDELQHIYEDADILHCEVIERVADEFIRKHNIEPDDFDNVTECGYMVPDYWTMGDVYGRLIEDVMGDEDEISHVVLKVYNSWIDDAISNYNTDFYYQPRDYIAACYIEGKVL